MRGKSGIVVPVVLALLCFVVVARTANSQVVACIDPSGACHNQSGPCPKNWTAQTTPCGATPTPTPAPVKCNFCLSTTGACQPMGGILTVCNSPNTCVAVCPSTTPTPTAAPTATPTPTAAPLALNWTPMGALPIAYTYDQQWWIQIRADSTVYVTGNSGHLQGDDTVPPALGTSANLHTECLTMRDFSGPLPKFRELTCSYRDTTDMYEQGDFILVPCSSGLCGASIYTLRFPDRDWSNDQHDGILQGATLSGFDGTLFLQRDWWGSGSTCHFPLGIVTLHGHVYLYGWIDQFAADRTFKAAWVERILLSEDIVQPSFSDLFSQADLFEGFGQIVADPTCDGCLLAFDNPYPPGTSVTVYRSRDEGRTWPEIAFTLPMPSGYIGVGDCHVAVHPGGLADVAGKRWGICQAYKGLDWSTAGQFIPMLWSEPNATPPTNFTTSLPSAMDKE